MSTDPRSQRTENVVDAFKKPINNLYLSVYNKVYHELTKESINSFKDGWTEAVAYMKSHPDCTSEELFQAKEQVLKERYRYARITDLEASKEIKC